MAGALFDRDLSWLTFNHRVLEEAADPSVPLFERIKFLAIYSSNLDEFFRVRVASLQAICSDSDEESKALLDEIYRMVQSQQEQFGKIFSQQIIPLLKDEGIRLNLSGDIPSSWSTEVRRYFMDQVVHELHPTLLKKSMVRPFLSNGSIHLLVELHSRRPLKHADSVRKPKFALLAIPDGLPRFFQRADGHGGYDVLFLDDVIRANLALLFPGYSIVHVHSFKVSRSADLGIEDEFEGNLVDKIRSSLSKRKEGIPSRFLYDEKMPAGMLNFMVQYFGLANGEPIPGGRYHRFSDFFSFPNPFSPRLERPIPQPLNIPGLDAFSTMFEAIKHRDWLLHFPYQSYDYVVEFFNQAAFDPKVVEIKATQYRVAQNSSIVQALINAARNGKKVTVFVEVKARFDEELNLVSAQKMEQAGVRIIYSLPGLKVHAKVCLVTRKSRNKKRLRSYAYVSTGNFNEKTARIYSDQGYFTSNPEVCSELEHLFKELHKPTGVWPFKHILVARYNLVPDLKRQIDVEISNAIQGRPASIYLKMNNLEEEGMIQHLQLAAEAGVQVRVMVRSICRLKPNGIEVRRIVDKYLEHARIFCFENGGYQRVLMGSADWMGRNLFNRIELVIELNDQQWKEQLMEFMEIQWKDNLSARRLLPNMSSERIPMQGEAIRAQTAFYDFLRDSNANLDFSC
jgi:polyphosphate kinase